MSESQCSILLRAKLVGSRRHGYRYPVKVKSTLILAAVKRSYLKALTSSRPKPNRRRKAASMPAADPLAANKEIGDSCMTAVRSQGGYDCAYCPRNRGRSRGDRRRRSL